jgi:hypothetical protein
MLSLRFPSRRPYAVRDTETGNAPPSALGAVALDLREANASPQRPPRWAGTFHRPCLSRPVPSRPSICATASPSNIAITLNGG